MSERWYECMICRGRWMQLDARDPARHVTGCPNASPGDWMFRNANDVIGPYPVAGKPMNRLGAS